MKKGNDILQSIEEQLSETNREEFRSLKTGEKKLLASLQTIKSEYIAFILGFISAIVIDEVMAVFRIKVAEDVLGFIVSLCNILFFGLGSFCFLRFSADFSALQTDFDSKRTKTAGFNLLLTNFAETKESIDRM